MCVPEESSCSVAQNFTGKPRDASDKFRKITLPFWDVEPHTVSALRTGGMRSMRAFKPSTVVT